MFTNNDLLDALIWTNRRRPIDPPLSPSPSLDLPYGQAGGTTCSPAGAIPTTTSTIGSPFLDDEQTPASCRKAAHELPPIPLNLSACSDSFTISTDSTGSSRGTCPIAQAISDACCDHGRALLDLRCTMDLIQYQLIELQKKTAMFCDSNGNTTPAQKKDRISSNNREISPSDSIKDVLLSPPDNHLPSESSVNNTSPESSCTFSDILSIATPNKTVCSLCERAGTDSMARDRDSGTAHSANHAVSGASPTPSTQDPADRLNLNFRYVQNELDSLRVRIMDCEDRVANNEVETVSLSKKLDKLPNDVNETCMNEIKLVSSIKGTPGKHCITRKGDKMHRH